MKLLPGNGNTTLAVTDRVVAEATRRAAPDIAILIPSFGCSGVRDSSRTRKVWL